MPEHTESAHQRRKIAALTAALALIMTLAVVAVGATPASAACGDVAYSRSYIYAPKAGYNMGNWVRKANAGCYDADVRYSSVSTTHRGEYYSSNTGRWYWSAVGPRFISSGTKNPVVTIISGSIVATTPVAIGTINYGGTGTWWV